MGHPDKPVYHLLGRKRGIRIRHVHHVERSLYDAVRVEVSQLLGQDCGFCISKKAREKIHDRFSSQ